MWKEIERKLRIKDQAGMRIIDEGKTGNGGLIKTKNLYKAHQLVADLKKSTVLEFKQNYPAGVDNASLRFSLSQIK